MIRIEGIATVAARLAAARKAMFTQSTRKIRRTAKIVAQRQKHSPRKKSRTGVSPIWRRSARKLSSSLLARSDPTGTTRNNAWGNDHDSKT